MCVRGTPSRSARVSPTRQRITAPTTGSRNVPGNDLLVAVEEPTGRGPGSLARCEGRRVCPHAALHARWGRRATATSNWSATGARCESAATSRSASAPTKPSGTSWTRAVVRRTLPSYPPGPRTRVTEDDLAGRANSAVNRGTCGAPGGLPGHESGGAPWWPPPRVSYVGRHAPSVVSRSEALRSAADSAARLSSGCSTALEVLLSAITMAAAPAIGSTAYVALRPRPTGRRCV